MTIDRYTKTILTVIAIGIWLLAAAIIFQPSPIRATDEQQNINIEKIGGSYVYGALPVEIQGTVSIELENPPVFTLEE